MSQQIRLCDFNISELKLKQIKELFQTLVQQSSNSSSLMCQHTIRITTDKKKLIFTQENCEGCRSELRYPNRGLEERFQLTGVLIYLLGNQQIERRISNYDLAQQIFRNFSGYFKDVNDFFSICSIFDLNTYQSIQNKIIEIKRQIRNDDEKFLLPIQKEIKFERFVLVVVDNFKGQLKNNSIENHSLLIKSFKNFLEQYQNLKSYLFSDQLCIHNVNLRSKQNDIWKLSINFYNNQCKCQNKGLAKIFFSFVTTKNYDGQNEDLDESNLISKIIELIEETSQKNDYSEECDNLLRIFTELEQSQNKNFPSSYPQNDDKITFFSLLIQRSLLKLSENYLWKGYQIYVLQDFIERIENEMMLNKKEYSQHLNHYKREQVNQIQEVLKHLKIRIFSQINKYYSNLSLEKSQQQQVHQLSEELEKKRVYVQKILQSESLDQNDRGFQQLIEKRLNYQQLRQSNIVNRSNIQQSTGIQQSSIISQQI